MSKSDSFGSIYKLASYHDEPLAKWRNDPRELKVTVAIAAFKQMERLKSTLDSLSLQSHKNLECIIITSQEVSSSITAVLESKYPFELTTYPFESDKHAAAYNRAATLARGHYLQFIQSGDLYLSSEALSKMVEAAIFHFTPDLVYMGTLFFSSANLSTNKCELYNKANLRKGIAPATLGSSLVLRKCFLENSKFDTSFDHLYELEWFCRMRQKIGFQFIGQEFYPIERNMLPLRASEKLQQIAQLRKILWRHFGFVWALLGWWSAKPLKQFSRWLRLKSSENHAGYSWQLLSGR